MFLKKRKCHIWWNPTDLECGPYSGMVFYEVEGIDLKGLS